MDATVTLHPISVTGTDKDATFTCKHPAQESDRLRALADTTIECATGTTQADPAKGNYTVTIATTVTGQTFSTDAATGAYYRIDNGGAAIADDAVKSQEIDLEDDTKKTFAVKFAAAVNPIPRIYGQHYPEVEIPCTLDQAGTTATCSPTENHLKDGDNKILMRTGCVATGTDTTIVVKFEGASSMITLGKVLLIALASFLL